MMYDDLISAMRKCATDAFACITCTLDSNPSCTDILMKQAADAIEELQKCVDGLESDNDNLCKRIEDLQKQLQKSEEDNINLTGWLAEEHAKKCPHYIRNVHDRGDDSLCDKWVCEIKSLPKWIPVTERLPENYERVLTCDGHENIHIMSHDKRYEYPFGIKPEHPRYYMPKWWMPLPEPPKDGEA